ATETFVSFGKFDTEWEAKALLAYLKSKFARMMLGTKKVTQGNKNEKVWQNVPTQDFSPQSDIDWTQPIPEIDKQLFAKYKLNQEEIDFINANVTDMK
ncbi:MAG: type II restriction endonuclease subunit R, partial [Firmicutes bacterium]|nr:type II restriction endonuclease subunit R [Bacillota bacterium]